MGFTKKRNIFFILIILVFLSLIFYYFGFMKTSCDSERCFETLSQDCSPLKYQRSINNNIYKYTISRSLGQYCKVNIKFEKTSEGTNFETKERLEGKSMLCLIPKSELSLININEVENLLKYCTGQLKEGIYEIIIKKMYSIIISNLGEILGEVQTSLIKKI